jgi:hypothetical protein
MRFFEKCRPQFYFHGGRLVKDGKTGKQHWRFDMVITLKPEKVLSCDDVLRNNYESINVYDNSIEELKIGAIVAGQILEFFALEDHTAPVIRLGACDLTDLKMTRVDDLTELWIRMEVENTDALHKFVRDYVFQRLWVEFSPAQPAPGAKPKSVQMTLKPNQGSVN